MKKLLLLIFFIISFISCSGDKQHISHNIREKVQNLTDSEIINELIIKTNGDKEKLGRILGCSISTIDRVKNQVTYLTNNSRKECQSLLIDVEFNGTKVLNERDPYNDSWIRSTASKIYLTPIGEWFSPYESPSSTFSEKINPIFESLL